jgi:hypothetical protein
MKDCSGVACPISRDLRTSLLLIIRQGGQLLLEGDVALGWQSALDRQAQPLGLIVIALQGARHPPDQVGIGGGEEHFNPPETALDQPSPVIL